MHYIKLRLLQRLNQHLSILLQLNHRHSFQMPPPAPLIFNHNRNPLRQHLILFNHNHNNNLNPNCLPKHHPEEITEVGRDPDKDPGDHSMITMTIMRIIMRQIIMKNLDQGQEEGRDLGQDQDLSMMMNTKKIMTLEEDADLEEDHIEVMVIVDQ